MSKYWCLYCKVIADEDELETRLATPEDDVPQGTKIAVCPWCHESDGLEPAGECEICGEAIEPDTHLCDECRDEMDKEVEGLIEKFRGDWFESKEKFLDYLEERWF